MTVSPGSASDLVTARVTHTLEALAAAVAPVGVVPAEELVGPVTALAAKGKRMRATLLLASHAAAGGTDGEAALGVAAALELFQTAALVHDDVLDRSDSRRGMPSTHRAIEAAHRSAGLLGDAEAFGVGGAILAGDLALMGTMRALSLALAGTERAIATEVTERFCAMAALCTAGQYLDLRLADTPLDAVTGADIHAVMRSKTASYTAEGPLALGAALAGAPSDAVDAWAAVGVPLGIAFQLRDDILGTVGDASVTGKPAGDDLKEGKRTVLVIRALESGSAAQREALLAVLGRHDAPERALATALEALTASGAVAAVEQQIDALATQARTALAALAVAPEHEAPLLTMIDAAARRDA